MTRLLITAALVLVVAGIAAALQRRRPDAPTQPRGYAVPAQLDRTDFERSDAPWLVAVFTSATCVACADAWDKARHLDSEAVAVQQVDLGEGRALHRRYGVEAVPMVIVADDAGVVRASFLGPPTASDLWATVAELRAPGSTPEACDHHQSAPPG